MKLSPTPLRIGTRGSALALWQTEWIRSLLAGAGQETQRVQIKTTGDLAPEVPLSQLGSRALFTKQIDDALLEGRIDLAVHSLKDLPTQLPPGIVIGAVGQREDPSDALVTRGGAGWKAMPEGAVIGTSSLRRRAQLLHARPDLRIVDLRGNVDTRVSKLDSNREWTAIVLAAAGLLRLGLGHRIVERLSAEVMLAAPGQGALAVTVRTDDRSVAGAIRETVHDPATGLQVSAERAFLSRLEGGCQVPVAAQASLHPAGPGTVLRLHGRVLSPDGNTMMEGRQAGTVADEEEAAQIGVTLAEQLLADGAGAILGTARTTPLPVVTEP
ncbi:MAG TPA: hydroxymethylbilane synthase [Gemmatimonadales bacterium]|nr:hydroxymethylbilane synthase [Gemmatimonadales bacterium]